MKHWSRVRSRQATLEQSLVALEDRLAVVERRSAAVEERTAAVEERTAAVQVLDQARVPVSRREISLNQKEITPWSSTFSLALQWSWGFSGSPYTSLMKNAVLNASTSIASIENDCCYSYSWTMVPSSLSESLINEWEKMGIRSKDVTSGWCETRDDFLI